MATLFETADGGGTYTLPDATPHDWTEGTGVFPASGIITVAAPPQGKRRKWLYVQNQDTTLVTLGIAAKTAIGVACVGNIILASGATAGAQGSNDERGPRVWTPNGQVTITGTAAKQVCILEVLE